MIPYALGADLVNAPLGIDWGSIPFLSADKEQQAAELNDLLWDATNSCDSAVFQPIRATADVESLNGPDQRLSVYNGSGGSAFGPYGWNAPGTPQGLTKAIMSHWPILDIIGAQVAQSAQFPPQWRAIPTDSLIISQGMTQLLGGSELGTNFSDGMNEIDIQPGYITWGAGRNGFRVQIGYINGWPHSGLTEACEIGATQLLVDDVTGMLGTMPVMQDGVDTEVVRVIAAVADNPIVTAVGTVQAGPGTLTLATGTQNAHNGPTFSTLPTVAVTCIPSNVRWACFYFASGLALTRGATSISAQQLPGSQQDIGGPTAASLEARAQAKLKPIGRVF